MLQQTRVQTVLPYYERFLKRFPNIESLAFAQESEVLEHWAGLGYYRRARQLRIAAGKMVSESAGKFPETFEEIMQLPGVGRYTAGAIYSIAFNRPQPVVDGNVRRVIGRLHGIARAPDSYFWRQAEAWMAKDAAADFNQAVMELGALVCIPARPLCGECPLKSLCRSGRQNCVPSSRGHSGRVRESVELVMLVPECDGRILLARQLEAGVIPGEWGLPLLFLKSSARPLANAKSLAYEIFGSGARLHKSASVRHAITHKRILAHVYGTTVQSPALHPGDAGRFAWFPRRGLDRLLISSLFHKALAVAEPVHPELDTTKWSSNRPRIIRE
jgi:A/G-specific adenine glycosylase